MSVVRVTALCGEASGRLSLSMCEAGPGCPRSSHSPPSHTHQYRRRAAAMRSSRLHFSPSAGLAESPRSRLRAHVTPSRLRVSSPRLVSATSPLSRDRPSPPRVCVPGPARRPAAAVHGQQVTKR